jgi:L-amino acid N-acyltransferase YncA
VTGTTWIGPHVAGKRAGSRQSGRWPTVKPGRTKIIEPMIRLASPDDLPAIVDIYNEAVDDRFATADLRLVTVSDRKPWFDAHDPSSFPIYVFVDQGSVRGWCSLSSYRSGREAVLGTAEISYYVGRGSRNRGVGSALVQSAVRSAPQLGKRVLFGILLERNQASIRLMQKCGFELWGRLPDVALIDGVFVSHLYYGRKV